MRKNRCVINTARRDYATPWGVEFPGRKTFKGASKVPFGGEAGTYSFHLEETRTAEQRGLEESSRLNRFWSIAAVIFVLLMVTAEFSMAEDEVLSVTSDTDPDNVEIWVGCPDKIEAIREDQERGK